MFAAPAAACAYVQEEVESPEVHFEPVVKLAPVELKTNEEDETELFKMFIYITHHHFTHTLYTQLSLSLSLSQLLFFTIVHTHTHTHVYCAGEQSCLGLTTVQRARSGRREGWVMSSLCSTRAKTAVSV